MWMHAPFSTLPPTILNPTGSVTSSPASAAGPTLSRLPIFPLIEKYGLEAVLVSLSPSRAAVAGLLTTAISGRSGITLSRSDDLQRFLESRLRARLNGSLEREVIWKKWVTPWGQCLSKPRATVRRNYEIVFGLWPTMTANAKATSGYNEGGNSAGQVALRKIIVAVWPANRASPNENRNTRSAPSHGKSHGVTVAGLVQDLAIVCWPASAARDWKGAKASSLTMERNSRPLNEMVFATWSTLRATDGE